ncbi:hypothetical protein NDU88_007784 [Pleurodeles waltl]|uniref:Uncharacterized protein n=1 Tax=Pleurodeles waltl TaxID=8319 RepID=A0AAV7VQP0_PLEWA|nr:hypothetical protein NDU88_007784 [Pleurodeles waltl]
MFQVFQVKDGLVESAMVWGREEKNVVNVVPGTWPVPGGAVALLSRTQRLGLGHARPGTRPAEPGYATVLPRCVERRAALRETEDRVGPAELLSRGHCCPEGGGDDPAEERGVQRVRAAEGRLALGGPGLRRACAALLRPGGDVVILGRSLFGAIEEEERPAELVPFVGARSLCWW